jgi:glucose/arabinose dehydrogenase
LSTFPGVFSRGVVAIAGAAALLLAVAPVGAASPAAPAAPATPATPAQVPPQVRIVTTGLEAPWGMAFLPDGTALVTERDRGRVLSITSAGQVEEAGTVEDVAAGGEGGLLGIAVSPDFATNRFVYLYYTAAADNRIVRVRYDGGRIGGQELLVTGIPKGVNHNGGRIAFGPDGMLYAGVGETGDSSLSQDLNSLGGKILRITPDGEPAPGNPFGTRVWSYGHRNVQGLAWDDQGRMYATEFGQNTYDEVNLIEPGKNYGWPTVEGPSDDSRFTAPLVTWSTAEASPSGLAIAEGALWVAALRGQRLWRVPLNTDGSLGTPQALLDSGYGRLRAVVPAPDGTLWVATSTGGARRRRTTTASSPSPPGRGARAAPSASPTRTRRTPKPGGRRRSSSSPGPTARATTSASPGRARPCGRRRLGSGTWSTPADEPRAAAHHWIAPLDLGPCRPARDVRCRPPPNPTTSPGRTSSRHGSAPRSAAGAGRSA